MSFFDPLQYGAKADGKTVDSKAIQAAIDAAEVNGGGTVVFKAGKVYYSGSLVLKSNVFLHMEQGSLLQCSHDFADITEHWPGGAQLPTHHDQIYSGSFLTTRAGTKNVGITGPGVIDGGAAHDNYRGPWVDDHYEPVNERPFLLFFIGCEGVTLRDVTFRESAFWTVRLSGCEDVLINGIRIRGNLNLPNCDGIDLDRCRRCRVSDCDIICADDGVSIKGCREFEGMGVCEDIVVNNCTIITKSSALVIGVDASCPLRNVTFANCVIRDSNRGLSVNLGEDSLYENILFSNIIVETRVWSHKWWGRGEPIYVSATAWEDKLGSIRNVRFTNILARSECGAYLAADKLGDIEGIVLDNVRMELGPWSGSKHPEEQGGEYDRRPTSGERQVYRPTEGIAGFHLENIQGVTIKNSEVVWRGGGDKYFANAVWARGCEALKVDVDGEAFRKDLKPIDVA